MTTAEKLEASIARLDRNPGRSAAERESNRIRRASAVTCWQITTGRTWID